MSNIKIVLTGVPELDELYVKLKRGAQKSVSISAFRKASKPIINTAKSNLPSQYRDIKKSLGVKPDRYRPILTMGARRYGNFKGHLAHIVNDGTDDRRYISKRKFIHKTGKIIGSNFWDSAVNTNKSTVEKTIVKYIIESFTRYITNANKRKKTESK